MTPPTIDTITDSHGHCPSGQRPPISRADILFFAVSILYIYSQLFQFPFTPFYFEGDHMLSISNAIRMLDGEVIYRDFFHLTPPGAELVYVCLFAIFGVKIWVLNAVIFTLIVSTTGFIWFFTRHVLAGVAVYLPAIIFLTIGLRIFGTDGSYRMFSMVFVLAGVAVLFLMRSSRNLVIAGAFCGLASFFVQPRGVVGLAGIAAFLIWEAVAARSGFLAVSRRLAFVVVPFVLIVVAENAYFIWQAGSEAYYFALIEFLQKYYPNDPLAKMSAYLSDFPDWSAYRESLSPAGAAFRYIRFVFPSVFYYALIPLVYVAYLVLRWLRNVRSENFEVDARLMLLTLVGLALTFGTSAPTGFRLYHIAGPGLVILVWTLSRFNFQKATLSVIVILLTTLGIAYAIQRQTVPSFVLDMPAGRASFLPKPIFDKYKWLADHTTPGETIFEAYHPSFYFPMHLKNPTPLYLVRDSNYTPPFQVESVVAALERDRPKLIIWNGNWSKRGDERLPGDNLDPLWQFISRNYVLAVEFPEAGEHTMNSFRDVEIWTLNGTSISE